MQVASNFSTKMKVNELPVLLMELNQRTGDKNVQNILSIVNDDDFDLSLLQKKYENMNVMRRIKA